MLLHLPHGRIAAAVADAMTEAMAAADLAAAVADLGPGQRDGRPRPDRRRGDLESTSATPTRRGSAAPTRTPTGCCASTSPRAPTCPSTPRRPRPGRRPAQRPTPQDPGLEDPGAGPGAGARAGSRLTRTRAGQRRQPGAAAHLPGCRARLRGRPSAVQGAAHRAARDGPAGPPWTRSLCRPGRAGPRAGGSLPATARHPAHPGNLPPGAATTGRSPAMSQRPLEPELKERAEN